MEFTLIASYLSRQFAHSLADMIPIFYFYVPEVLWSHCLCFIMPTFGRDPRGDIRSSCEPFYTPQSVRKGL